MGESQPEEPEGGLLSPATIKQSDLQAQCNSRTVESIIGNQVITHQNLQNRKERKNNLNAQGQVIETIVETS
jgi:hypothetical protein